MGPLHYLLHGGDRTDKWITGLSIGSTVSAPVAQAIQAVPAEFTPASLGAGFVLLVLTLGRMHYAHLAATAAAATTLATSTEQHRHTEAMIQLEVEKIMASKGIASPVHVVNTGPPPPGTAEMSTRPSPPITPFDDPDRRE